MPKIAEIEPTPNPNAMKFILKEPLTWGISRSYDNAETAKDDPLASKLFDIYQLCHLEAQEYATEPAVAASIAATLYISATRHLNP